MKTEKTCNWYGIQYFFVQGYIPRCCVGTHPDQYNKILSKSRYTGDSVGIGDNNNINIILKTCRLPFDLKCHFCGGTVETPNGVIIPEKYNYMFDDEYSEILPRLLMMYADMHITELEETGRIKNMTESEVLEDYKKWRNHES